MKTELSYCASLVRAHDHDRYVCALFAPEDIREALFALFAFNHEIASIPEIVSEEMIGFMRFAWWREALDEIYSGGPVRKHLVAEALAQAVKQYSLPRAPLDAMLEAREAALGEDIVGHPERWEAYFYATSSGLLKLCAVAAGLEPGPALDDLGIAWGCIGTARLLQAAGRQEPALLETAEARLAASCNVPAIFGVFKDAAAFYYRRVKAGKPAGREVRFQLICHLLWRKFIKRFNLFAEDNRNNL